MGAEVIKVRKLSGDNRRRNGSFYEERVDLGKKLFWFPLYMEKEYYYRCYEKWKDKKF